MNQAVVQARVKIQDVRAQVYSHLLHRLQFILTQDGTGHFSQPVSLKPRRGLVNGVFHEECVCTNGRYNSLITKMHTSSGSDRVGRSVTTLDHKPYVQPDAQRL